MVKVSLFVDERLSLELRASEGLMVADSSFRGVSLAAP